MCVQVEHAKAYVPHSAAMQDQKKEGVGGWAAEGLQGQGTLRDRSLPTSKCAAQMACDSFARPAHMLSSWFLRGLEEWDDVCVALEAAWLARCVGVGNG
jgi:hypothetical protein